MAEYRKHCLVSQINAANPPAAKLGTVVKELIEAVNALRADNLALRAQLNADPGTGIDYQQAAAVPDEVAPLGQR